MTARLTEARGTNPLGPPVTVSLTEARGTTPLDPR